MELLVCCPFGQYELTLDVTSYSDTEGKPEKRVAWRIENGYDGVIVLERMLVDVIGLSKVYYPLLARVSVQ